MKKPVCVSTVGVIIRNTGKDSDISKKETIMRENSVSSLNGWTEPRGDVSIRLFPSFPTSTDQNKQNDINKKNCPSDRTGFPVLTECNSPSGIKHWCCDSGRSFEEEKWRLYVFRQRSEWGAKRVVEGVRKYFHSHTLLEIQSAEWSCAKPQTYEEMRWKKKKTN